MSRTLHSNRARATLPSIGPWLPTAMLHVVFLVVSIALCLLALKEPFLLAIGLLLAVTGTFIPNLVPRWCVLIVLGLGQLWREKSATDPIFYVLLAGVHLLHVVGSLSRWMQWNGRMQSSALLKPLQRFLLTQIVVQTAAVGALKAFSAGPGTVQGLSILSAALLGTLAFVLARALRQASVRE